MIEVENTNPKIVVEFVNDTIELSLRGVSLAQMSISIAELAAAMSAKLGIVSGETRESKTFANRDEFENHHKHDDSDMWYNRK